MALHIELGQSSVHFLFNSFGSSDLSGPEENQ